MRFASVSAFLGLAACVCAGTINVMVAQGGTLTYTPSRWDAPSISVRYELLTAKQQCHRQRRGCYRFPIVSLEPSLRFLKLRLTRCSGSLAGNHVRSHPFNPLDSSPDTIFLDCYPVELYQPLHYIDHSIPWH